VDKTRVEAAFNVIMQEDIPTLRKYTRMMSAYLRMFKKKCALMCVCLHSCGHVHVVRGEGKESELK
jgi:hypothetical protein